jgi:hypothetical protein
MFCWNYVNPIASVVVVTMEVPKTKETCSMHLLLHGILHE